MLILRPDFLSAPHLAPLLEWSPTIVVAGEVLHEVLKSGIKIDAVVFPEEQAKEVEELLQDQLPVDFIPLSRQESLLLKALSFLAGKEQQAVNILAATERGDHLLLELSHQEWIANVVLLNGKEKSALCRSGSYTKWYPAREIIKINPAGRSLCLARKGLQKM